MAAASLKELEERIEALRRQLHQAVPSIYSPEKLVAAAPISAELDRLIVEYMERKAEAGQ